MSGYEFTPHHNKIFESFSLIIIFVSIMLMFGGLIRVITGIVQYSEISGQEFGLTLASSSLEILIGILFIRPTDNFRNIARTEGSDIRELLRGLSEINFTLMIMILLTFGILALTIGETFFLTE